MNKSASNSRVQQILDSIDQMRPLPTNATRVLSALENPNISARVVSEYVGLDQALTALILRLANSVSLGYARNCSTLQEAIVRLGFKRVRSLVMAASTGTINRELAGYRLGTGELWNHSIATAMAAEWLARKVGYQEPEEAYVAGLLHDMGKTILDQYVLKDYSRIVDVMNRFNLNLWEAEQEMLGVDHARVGGLMAEKWEFPVVLIDTIQFHHAPSLARSRQALPAIVNFANSISVRSSKSVLDLFNKNIHPETPAILNLDVPELQRVEAALCKYLGM